jgi:DNA-binding MarR family transcriptional regulator
MSVIKELEKYLEEVLGVKDKAVLWRGQRELPIFLKELYVFYEISYLGRSCLVVLPRDGSEITPANLVKHFKHLQAKWKGLCFYAYSTISFYNRQRLIENRIPFVIPYNQMYLPDMGIDLREHFLKERNHVKIFSPPTQAVIIYALTRRKPTSTPSELAKELNYTKMTLTRAFDELDSLDIGQISHSGRERRLYFMENRKVFWEKVKPLMTTPVKKRIWLRQNSKTKELLEKFGVVSGLSALAVLSMLNRPRYSVFAIDMKTWKAEVKRGAIQEIPFAEEADIELELWSYNPKLFEENGLADIFSIYLSLQHNKDERVEAALEKLLDGICGKRVR